MNAELLKKYGIDYEKGMRNCMNDGNFYKMMLSMFLEDKCFPKAREAYASGDCKELFANLHELKGVSGNTALTALYDAVVPLVEIVRHGNAEKSVLDPLFEAAEEAYKTTIEGISLAVGK